MALMTDRCWLTRTVSLADRFGDNGLICVLLGHVAGDTLAIDTWLMSCRVLKRGVEALLHNHLCRWAAAQGIKRIAGEYIPTVPWAACLSTCGSSGSPSMISVCCWSCSGSRRASRTSSLTGPVRSSSRRATSLCPM